MSGALPNKSFCRRINTAKAFLFIRIFFITLSIGINNSWASDITPTKSNALNQACLTGFNAVNPPDQLLISSSTPSHLVHPSVANWINQRHWQQTFDTWQHSLTCAASPQDHCGLNPTFLSTRLCQNPEESLNFLLTHIYLLQSMTALWPELNTDWSAWRKFPQAKDFTLDGQKRFKPWTNATLEMGLALDNLGSLNRTQLLNRWPSEAELAQFMVCGNTQTGLAPNSLYHSMINYLELQNDEPLLNQIGFWKTVAWFERVLTKYRRAQGKSKFDPTLQAHIMQQCEQFTQWAAHTHTPLEINKHSSKNIPTYIQGALNPVLPLEPINIRGKIIQKTVMKTGYTLYLIRPNALGISPFWAAPATPLNDAFIHTQTEYQFWGSVIHTPHDFPNHSVSPLKTGKNAFSLKHISEVF